MPSESSRSILRAFLGLSVLFCFLITTSTSFAAGDAKNLVRIEVTSKADIERLPRGLDIPGHKPGEWVDAVITDQQIEDLVSRGLFVQLLHKNVDELMRDAQASYPTYSQFVTDLEAIATNYPSITVLDTIGYSYENRPIQVLKISDNPDVDESEPEVILYGLTHAREWPSLTTSMFIADSLTKGYGSDANITNMVDGREIWVMPCLNPDGYVYTRDNGIDWRKNRRPFPEFGTVGVDLNRNHGGSYDGAPEGEWGSMLGSISHNPDQATYCGPMPFSEPETQVERDFILSRDFVCGISYHTYSELVLWPYGYSTDVTAPNNLYLVGLGNDIADVITQEDGTGTYEPTQSSGLYPTSGDATDWAYGYHHYVLGDDMVLFTVEIGQQFQPPTTHLPQIHRENFDGAWVLLEAAEDIGTDLTPRVIPADMGPDESFPSGNYTIDWTENNPGAPWSAWQIDELSGLTVITDGLNGLSNRFLLDGFSFSTARAYSGSHSLHSSSDESEAVDAFTSVHPYPVQSGDSLTFWIWHDIEEDWDFGYVEISTDGREFDIIETYTGSTSGWERRAFSLETYEGKSIFIRFRYTTDSYVTEEGMYIDEVYPAAFFTNVNTLSSSVATTEYDVVGNSSGTYHYRVRALSAQWGWNDYSQLKKVQVLDTGAGTIAGTVTDSVSGAPLTGALVELYDGMTVVGSDVTDIGEYSIAGVDTGTYDLQVTATNYETKSISGVEILSQQITNQDVELASILGSFSGVVTDSVSGGLVDGALVEVLDGAVVVGSDITTAGAYLIDSIPEGTYDIVVSATYYQTKTVADVDAIARQNVEIDIDVAANWGVISGTVVDSVSGDPLDDVLVEALDGTVVIGSDITVGSAFSIDSLIEGDYDVRVSEDYHETKTIAAISIAARDTSTVDIEMAAAWGYLAGYVTDSISSDPITTALVEVYFGLVTVDSDSTDNTGFYIIDSLLEAEYQAAAIAAGYTEEPSGFFQIAARGTTFVDFEMIVEFMCGDANRSFSVDIDDIVHLIAYVFAGGPAPDPVIAGDVDCSGGVDIDDIVYLIDYVFSSGPEPCADCS